ncbi:transcription factor E2F5-like isoform X1 [Synchiropus splendidus]|uniref:transcription factor E2F5-like isoform X1 n=1 Tax=Synchiropus splendidus TaxID=270530 RepID=UPI00237E9DC7|nr:transcription factor E2F5-like isoform X1 [Synchiropus splendidus]
MEFEVTETVRSTPSRYEKSLGRLTMKFVSLLQEAEDGVLDLKVAADSLAVKQRRRIYDITNVLEGIGLIEKRNKNMIHWRGKNRQCQTQEVLQQLDSLKLQISELEAQEKQLDAQKLWLEENLKQISGDFVTSKYRYVTHEDLCNAFKGDNLLAVMAPAGSQLEVPLPEVGQSGQKKYQVNLRSCSAPIQVTFISRDSSLVTPMAFSVPPSDNIYSMPSPPSTPASVQRIPLSTSMYSNSSAYCSQDSSCSDHQMELPNQDALTLTPASPGPHTACFTQTQPVCEQQMDLNGPDFHSVLDMSSLLKLNTSGDHMREERDEAVDLIDELMSSDGLDYSFNLDETEGVCDLFDVQILNY